MTTDQYLHLADVISGVAAAHRNEAAVVGHFVREISVYFMDQDENFPTTLFINRCMPPKED